MGLTTHIIGLLTPMIPHQRKTPCAKNKRKYLTQSSTFSLASEVAAAITYFFLLSSFFFHLSSFAFVYLTYTSMITRLKNSSNSTFPSPKFPIYNRTLVQ